MGDECVQRRPAAILAADHGLTAVARCEAAHQCASVPLGFWGTTMRAWILAVAGLVLAMSPAAAQTVQPGWIADASTGCRVWNDHPRPKETITWSGRCENGLAQGNGVVQWFEDSRLA